MPACSPPGLSNDQLLAHLVSSEHIPTHHLGIDVGYYFFSVRAEGLIRTFSSVQESRMLGWDKALHTFTASFRPLPSRPYPSSHTERCSPKMLPFPPPVCHLVQVFLVVTLLILQPQPWAGLLSEAFLEPSDGASSGSALGPDSMDIPVYSIYLSNRGMLLTIR